MIPLLLALDIACGAWRRRLVLWHTALPTP